MQRLASIEATMQSFAAQLERLANLSFLQSKLTTCLAAIHRISNSSISSSTPRSRTAVPLPEGPPPNKKRLLDAEFEATSPGPEGHQLPDDVLMPIIDAYFTCVQNQPYSFFHEGNFRRRLAENDLADHLVLAVVASAMRFCHHPQLPTDSHELAVSYANKSWKSVVSNCFGLSTAANLSIVQTIALLALFDFTCKFNMSLS